MAAWLWERRQGPWEWRWERRVAAEGVRSVDMGGSGGGEGGWGVSFGFAPVLIEVFLRFSESWLLRFISGLCFRRFWLRQLC